ncbi:MAG: hypothetical protein IKV96_00390, partial [Firmicutes bacterium]|nr:hypothetical protein [Bacillota bacterium]
YSKMKNASSGPELTIQIGSASNIGYHAAKRGKVNSFLMFFWILTVVAREPKANCSLVCIGTTPAKSYQLAAFATLNVVKWKIRCPLRCWIAE